MRDFARGSKRTLVVILGRNRLWWDEKPRETYWNQPQNLQQHLVGVLSEDDARLYLTRCEITDKALQDEVLKDSFCAPEPLDPSPSSPNKARASEPGYHPWTLGLCGNTLWQLREDRGDNTFPPAGEFRFEDGEHGPTAVVDRFLRTQLDYRRRWIERLAVTLRFDATAALHACRAGEDESETAWERLREFSFLSRQPGSDWFILHNHMRSQILEILPAERESKDHEFWRNHWQSRSQTATDTFAALAWYHHWHLNPNVALREWNALAEELRRTTAMREHFEILSWIAPLRTESGNSAEVWQARFSYANELQQASLGNRAQNLHDAIACYDEALKVYTREALPQDWAMTQNNKGTALQELPDGDKATNLREAIACYDEALKVYTREALPQDWAATQNNKGTALQDLPDGDKATNLREAIACYDLALEVRTREALPQDWAATLANKSIALTLLGNFPEALSGIEAAIEGFREMGHAFYLQQAEGIRELILRCSEEQNQPSDA